MHEYSINIYDEFDVIELILASDWKWVPVNKNMCVNETHFFPDVTLILLFYNRNRYT